MRRTFVSNKTVYKAILIFCLTQLAACSFITHRFTSTERDGAPNVKVDVSKIPNAVPKKEALSKYGNKPYRVHGHSYQVLKSANGYDKVGLASWYGMDNHNKPTSTMEMYNVFAMTAASKELPIPCYVKVTNLRNGKHVIVRVNDRGPFINGRIIDLSYVAAKKLDFAEQGVAKVRVTAIDPETFAKEEPISKKSIYLADNQAKTTTAITKYKAAEPKQKPQSISKQGIYLQAGAYQSQVNAEKRVEKIIALMNVKTNIEPITKDGVSLYRVNIGPLISEAERSKIKALLAKN